MKILRVKEGWRRWKLWKRRLKKISYAIEKALRRMKNGEAAGPADSMLPLVYCIGERTIEFLVKQFNLILDGEKMPGERRKSVLVLILIY